jgi:hypothetical protein
MPSRIDRSNSNCINSILLKIGVFQVFLFSGLQVDFIHRV